MLAFFPVAHVLASERAVHQVLAKASESCTHIVYKSGKSSTVAWHRRQEDPKPYMVGISWVTRCKESGKRLDEDVYKIDPEQMEIFKKVTRMLRSQVDHRLTSSPDTLQRRRSMEPKQLHALLAAGNAEAQHGDRSSESREQSDAKIGLIKTKTPRSATETTFWTVMARKADPVQRHVTALAKHDKSMFRIMLKRLSTVETTEHS